MQILAFSDLHGRHEIFDKLTPRLNWSTLDVIAACGDLTQFGDFADATAIVNKLQTLSQAEVFTIHGNCDPSEVLLAMQASGTALHQRTTHVQNQRFFGYGNVPPTPFGTRNELLESDILRDLENVEPFDIGLFHAPAYQINDEPRPGLHGGCHAIRDLIQRAKPKLMLHGHIHEGCGYTIYDYAKQKVIEAHKFSDQNEIHPLQLLPHWGVIINLAAAKNGAVQVIELEGDRVSIERIVV